VRAGRLGRGLRGQQLEQGHTAPLGLVPVVGRDGVLEEPGEDVADPALPGLVAVLPGDDAAVHHPAHAGHLGERRRVHHVAGRGTHNGHHLTRSDGVGRGRGDVRVHVADRDGDSFRQPGPPGRLGGQAARPGPQRRDRMGQLVLGEAGETGVQRGEEVRRRVVAVLVDALVPGRAGVAGLGAAQLPDDPVGRLDPAVRLLVDVRVLLQQLESLGELPLRGDLAAVPADPRLAALVGQRVDPVGLGLGRVVLPQLGIGVRAALQPGHQAQRGPVAPGRQHRAGGEVGPDADHLGGIDPGRLDGLGYRLTQHVPVVLRVLQGPVRRQRLPGRGQPGVHHPVPVGADGGAELGAVADADHHGPAGERAEVHPDDVTVLLAAGPARSARAAAGAARSAGAAVRAVSANSHRCPVLPARSV
jgi:hypothetical protein